MALVGLGIAVGVGAVVGLTATLNAMSEDFERKLGEYGVSIVVIPKMEQLSLSYGGVTVAGTSEVKDFDRSIAGKLRGIKAGDALRIIAPKSLGVVEIEGKKVLIAGVDFSTEFKLKKWWKLIGRKPRGKDEILMGNEAAAMFFKKSGDKISIGGMEFTVAGKLEELGSYEDNLVFAEISQVQSLIRRPGRVNLVEIGADLKRYSIETLVAQIAEKVPEAEVTSFSPSAGSRDKTIETFARFSLIISAFVLTIGGVIVMITMMSSVKERSQEIGILRAMGFRKRHIAMTVFYEVAIICLASGIFGWLLGMGMAKLVVPVAGKASESIRPDISTFSLSVSLALLVGLAGSFYPASRAANSDPVEALRSI